MATHLITYDLSQPGRDYDKLIAAIKRYPGWCPTTESTWLIQTTESTSSVRDALARVMDANDKLFVVDVTGKAAAWRGLSAKVSEWIKKNL
jgi:hypothetical protein